MKIVLYILTFLTTNFAYAQFEFADLKYIDIKTSYGAKFGYSEAIDFQLINKYCSEINTCDEYEESSTYIGKLTLENKKSLEFHYSEGPSDDPTFIVFYKGEVILQAFGTTLHLKGKTIYIEGIANFYFNKKRKFQFINDEFQEIRQEFYDISVKGKLNFPIDIYQSEHFKNKVAHLPEGYQIEIVLGKTGGEYDDLEAILIKSEFGLLGWFDFKKIAYGKPLIYGFWFHGD